MTPRVVSWFSCGAASAIASKLAVDKYGPNCKVVYCDTLAYEHPDNKRFIKDVSKWLGVPILIARLGEYEDIWDVFTRTRFLKNRNGARCTTELKKKVRRAFQQDGDIQIFGYTSEEQSRIDRFKMENPEVIPEFILAEQGITKQMCYHMLWRANIELPAMYKFGYKNNNCIGCVKGGMGYWNKIRRDFPDSFKRMANMERELNFALCGTFLDELDPTAGRYEQEEDIECGVVCISGEGNG